MFEPSKKLVLLYHKARYALDKETRELTKEILKANKTKLAPWAKQIIKEVIQEEVYSLFIRLSKRQVIELGDNGYFYKELIPEIARCLDPNKKDPYLKLLYKELYEYTKTNPEHHWGNLYVSENRICLNVRQSFLDDISKDWERVDEIIKNPNENYGWVIT